MRTLLTRLGCGSLASLIATLLLTGTASAVPVRYFNEGDQLKVRTNSENAIQGAITMVALVNANELGPHYYIALLNSEGSPAGYKFQQTESHRLSITSFGGVANDSKTLPEGGWQLLAVTKAAGEAIPRFHVYSYAEESWEHSNASGSIEDSPGVSGGKIRFGGLGSEEYAAAALFPRALSDAEVEALAGGYDDWLELEPSGMWIFNQPDLSKPVLEERGGGANEIIGDTSGTEVRHSSTPPSEDPDGTIFRGDLYTGQDLEWGEEQVEGSSAEFSIEELSPPLPFENYFGHFTLSTGDRRSELRSEVHLYEGEDVYFRFLARLSEGFPVEHSANVWGELIWQLHQEGAGGSPPLALSIREGETGAGYYAIEDANDAEWWTGPEIDAGVWHEFVIRVNNSPEEEVGFVEVWMDGEHQKMTGGSYRYYGSTMLDEFNYPKSGYYRSEHMIGTGTVDIAGYRIAKSMADLP